MPEGSLGQPVFLLAVISAWGPECRKQTIATNVCHGAGLLPRVLARGSPSPGVPCLLHTWQIPQWRPRQERRETWQQPLEPVVWQWRTISLAGMLVYQMLRSRKPKHSHGTGARLEKLIAQRARYRKFDVCEQPHGQEAASCSSSPSVCLALQALL